MRRIATTLTVVRTLHTTLNVKFLTKMENSDVVVTKAAVKASSTSEAPETSEPKEPAKVEEAPAKVASSKGADREWVADGGLCKMNKQGFKDIKIDEDGTFSLIQFYAPDPEGWYAFIKGNLRHNEAELDEDKSNNGGSNFGKFIAGQSGEAWHLTVNWWWSDGNKIDKCAIETVITRK